MLQEYFLQLAFNEELHPRDYHGRWSQSPDTGAPTAGAEPSISGRQVLNTKLEDALKTVKLKNQKAYRKAVNTVLDKLTPAAIDRLSNNLEDFKFFDTITELNKHAKDEGVKGGRVAGAWVGQYQQLWLDGESVVAAVSMGVEKSTADVYAHEFSHAIDYNQKVTRETRKGLNYINKENLPPDNTEYLSDTEEWAEAAREIIKSPIALSAYLQKYENQKRKEIFAEFGRFVTNHEKDRAEKLFPLAWKFWKDRDLI